VAVWLALSAGAKKLSAKRQPWQTGSHSSVTGLRAPISMSNSGIIWLVGILIAISMVPVVLFLCTYVRWRWQTRGGSQPRLVGTVDQHARATALRQMYIRRGVPQAPYNDCRRRMKRTGSD